MANVTFDTKATGSGNLGFGTSTSVIPNVTLGTVGQNLLWIAIAWCDDGSGLSGSALSAVTVDGSAATFYASAVNGRNADVYYFLVNSGGNHTVTISADGDGGINYIICASSYQNVDPTTPLGTAVTATGLGSPITSVVTGVATTNMIADCAAIALTVGDTSAAVGAGQTQRVNLRVGGAIDIRGVSSDEPAIAGNTTMDWTLAINPLRLWSQVAGEILVGTASAVASKLPLLGVG